MQQASLPVKYRKEYQEKTNPHYQPPGFENQLNRPFDGVKLNQVYVGAESLLIPGKAGSIWRVPMEWIPSRARGGTWQASVYCRLSVTPGR